MLVEFFNLPHHLTSPIGTHVDSVPYNEQMRYTESCAPTWEPFDKWFKLNFNYHVAHHLYPAEYWVNLKEIDNIMNKHTINTQEKSQEKLNELDFSIEMRRKPFQEVMRQYIEYQNIEDQKKLLQPL
jgi:fatty acid desaturase